MPHALSLDDVRAALRSLPGWTLDPARPAIQCSFRFADFSEAWGFMSRCALYAEQHAHHPEWCNVWASVEVTLTTHDCGGISSLDLDFARFMSGIAPAPGG